MEESTMLNKKEYFVNVMMLLSEIHDGPSFTPVAMVAQAYQARSRPSRSLDAGELPIRELDSWP